MVKSVRPSVKRNRCGLATASSNNGVRREGASLVVGWENTAVDLVAQDAGRLERVLDSA